MKALLSIITFLILLNAHDSHAWGFKEFGEEAASPVTTDAKYVLIGGTALTLTILAFEDQLSDPFQKKQVRNKTLGDSSRWGDWMGQLVPNALYMGWMGIAGYNGNKEGYRRAIGMFKATAYSTSVTTVLKYTAREPRPIDHSWKNSFPSGHSTSAFAFSGYLMAEHDYWVGVPALLVSTFIGYSRINDNMHWLHDVTAGATIGWVYGWGISRLQKQKSLKEGESSAFIMPILDSKTAGFALYKEF
ncbi:MAG: phosphatase PAP2 family protein [Bdellovibrionota bacterium]